MNRRPRFRLPLVTAALAAVASAGLLAVQAPHATGLTGIPPLRAAYDLILNTRFDQAEQALKSACGPGPTQACEVLGASATWWRILLDPNDKSLDARFSSRVDAAIASCERWTETEPARAEAWFYLGAAYGARVSWRVQRGERLAAARDGKHIKDALERALTLDADMDDARFGIGLYRYYADIAPTVAKILRFLMMLPGGDRVEGLHDMEAVHERGVLLRGEADYQLHWIYLWYENQPRRAYALLVSLHDRYPANTHFLQRLAVIDDEYFHDAAASLADWQSMVDQAAKMGDPALAEVEGRLGAAVQLDALSETDRALADAERVVALAPTRPYGARAQAALLRGRFLDRLGQHAAALAAYHAAIAQVPRDDPDDVADRARALLRATPDGKAGEAYRTSLAGWRDYERGALDEAEAALARAASLAPGDQLIRVRRARVSQARSDTAAALAAFDGVIAARPSVPPLALSGAYLWSGQILEARGDLDEARARYRAAAHVFDGDSRLAHDAARALNRLGAK